MGFSSTLVRFEGRSSSESDELSPESEATKSSSSSSLGRSVGSVLAMWGMGESARGCAGGELPGVDVPSLRPLASSHSLPLSRYRRSASTAWEWLCLACAELPVLPRTYKGLLEVRVQRLLKRLGPTTPCGGRT